jgi:hypothetical protein
MSHQGLREGDDEQLLVRGGGMRDFDRYRTKGHLQLKVTGYCPFEPTSSAGYIH